MSSKAYQNIFKIIEWEGEKTPNYNYIRFMKNVIQRFSLFCTEPSLITKIINQKLLNNVTKNYTVFCHKLNITSHFKRFKDVIHIYMKKPYSSLQKSFFGIWWYTTFRWTIHFKTPPLFADTSTMPKYFYSSRLHKKSFLCKGNTLCFYLA